MLWPYWIPFEYKLPEFALVSGILKFDNFFMASDVLAAFDRCFASRACGTVSGKARMSDTLVSLWFTGAGVSYPVLREPAMFLRAT